MISIKEHAFIVFDIIGIEKHIFFCVKLSIFSYP